jgi:hypothetical protein
MRYTTYTHLKRQMDRDAFGGHSPIIPSSLDRFTMPASGSIPQHTSAHVSIRADSEAEYGLVRRSVCACRLSFDWEVARGWVTGER